MAEQQIVEMAEQQFAAWAKQQIAEMAPNAEQQLALERNKIPSLNLFPEEEKKKIVQRVIDLTDIISMTEHDHFRVKGKEIISEFSKAVGMATMIEALRPDIDNIDVYIRKRGVICFSIVASTLGVAGMLPFLREICNSKISSWQARHTVAMIVHEIAILLRSAALLLGSIAVFPHLEALKEIIEPHINDENSRVRTASAMAMTVITEAAAIRH